MNTMIFRYVSTLVKKVSVVRISFLSLLILSCSDLKRDNPIDPKNPDAEDKQIALVEDFIIVNTKPGGPVFPEYTKNSQDALNELKVVYDDQLLVLEYHMTPTDTNYADSLAVYDELEIKTRYNTYRGAQGRGFPHAFFNGSAKSIQGASAKDVAKSRYNDIVDSIAGAKSKTRVEAKKSFNGNELKIDVKLAQYGSLDRNNIDVEYIVFEDKGIASGHYSVREIISPSEAVTLVAAGSVLDLPQKSTTLPSFFDKTKIGVIVLVRDQLSKKIIQSNIAE